MKEVFKLIRRFCKEATDLELIEKLEAIESALDSSDEEIRNGLVRAAEAIREELEARREMAYLRRKRS